MPSVTRFAVSVHGWLGLFSTVSFQLFWFPSLFYVLRAFISTYAIFIVVALSFPLHCDICSANNSSSSEVVPF